MVRLNKIYTRTGDDGTTGIVDGSRVPKHAARTEAIGAVDEANSALGLALAGGLLGAAIAWLIFNNYTVSTLGSNFSQVVFAFKVSPALVATGLKWALAIGFIGGLFPALRAARLPVTVALREL